MARLSGIDDVDAGIGGEALVVGVGEDEELVVLLEFGRRSGQVEKIPIVMYHRRSCDDDKDPRRPCDEKPEKTKRTRKARKPSGFWLFGFSSEGLFQEMEDVSKVGITAPGLVDSRISLKKNDRWPKNHPAATCPYLAA